MEFEKALKKLESYKKTVLNKPLFDKQENKTATVNVITIAPSIKSGQFSKYCNNDYRWFDINDKEYRSAIQNLDCEIIFIKNFGKQVPFFTREEDFDKQYEVR